MGNDNRIKLVTKENVRKKPHQTGLAKSIVNLVVYERGKIK